MIIRIDVALAAVVLLLACPALAFERPAPPQVLFGDLYDDVELGGVFPDSKEFADATVIQETKILSLVPTAEERAAEAALAHRRRTIEARMLMK